MADDMTKPLKEENSKSEGNTAQRGSPVVGEKRKLTVKPMISMNLIKPQEKKGIGISLKLGSDPKKQKTEPVILEKKGAVASAFNNESDDEEEEMPAEAKMRMRNIGRETPTSAGPNSFNKGNRGFTDYRKTMEKSFKLQHPTSTKNKETKD